MKQLKIFLPNDPNNPLMWNRYHAVIFDWDPHNKYILYTDNIQEADIVPIICEYSIAPAQYDFLITSGYTNQTIL